MLMRKKFKFKKLFIAASAFFVGLASLIIPSHAYQGPGTESYGGAYMSFDDAYQTQIDSTVTNAVHSAFMVDEVRFPTYYSDVSMINVQILDANMRLANQMTRFYLFVDPDDYFEPDGFNDFYSFYREHQDDWSFPYCDVTFGFGTEKNATVNLVFQLDNINIDGFTLQALSGTYDLYVVNFPSSQQITNPDAYDKELNPYQAHIRNMYFDVDYSAITYLPREVYTNTYSAGYNEGYRIALSEASPSIQSAYQSGFEAGKNSINTQSIYNKGFEDGQADIENSIDEAYLQGVQAGRDEAFVELEDEAAAWEAGYRQGIKQTTGYLAGYAAGYAEGRAEVPNDTTTNGKTLIWTIAATPFEAFKTIFNFSILGINLAAFFFGIISVGIFIFILKKFL